ncbi:MAG: AraC family transcriptional regulator [Clostridia bacterium]|nr:AraC family transcriptional regulator [Clostridia bacterium]
MPQHSIDFNIGNLLCKLIILLSCDKENAYYSTYYEHHHSCPELQYIESGSCDLTCKKESFTVNAGQLLIIPPRVYHHTVRNSNNIRKLSIILDIVPSEDADSMDMAFYNMFFADKPILLSLKGTSIIQTLGHICSLLEEPELHYIEAEKLRAFCNLFLITLFDHTVNKEQIEEKISDKQIFSDEFIIDTFIAQEFKPKSSAEGLATKLHVSERQLHRIIKQKYNMNYREKLKEIRVEIATGFLTGTDKSIGEIAELLGYSNLSAFSAFMKNATGKTPRQIRKGK